MKMRRTHRVLATSINEHMNRMILDEIDCSDGKAIIQGTIHVEVGLGYHPHSFVSISVTRIHVFVYALPLTLL